MLNFYLIPDWSFSSGRFWSSIVAGGLSSPSLLGGGLVDWTSSVQFWNRERELRDGCDEGRVSRSLIIMKIFLHWAHSLTFVLMIKSIYLSMSCISWSSSTGLAPWDQCCQSGMSIIDTCSGSLHTSTCWGELVAGLWGKKLNDKGWLSFHKYKRKLNNLIWFPLFFSSSHNLDCVCIVHVQRRGKCGMRFPPSLSYLYVRIIQPPPILCSKFIDRDSTLPH